jgi:hypothetical protein
VRSRQYLSGRVHGRRAATLAYYDASLDEAGRASKLSVAAAEYDGDALDGFWRGAREIKPERLPRNVRARAGDLARDDKAARWQRLDTQLTRVERTLTYRMITAFAAVFGALVAVTTAFEPWRPTHLVVYAYCALFIAVNSWWLPPRAIRSARAYVDEKATVEREHLLAAAKANLKWTLLVFVCLFGGMVALIPLTQLR